MAVTAKWFSQAIKCQYLGGTSFPVVWAASGGDTIKIALFTGTVPTSGGTGDNQDTWVYRSSLTATEASGTGYSAGGKMLTLSDASYDSASNEVRLTAANVSWTGATLTAVTHAVMYKSTGVTANDPLIGFIDFGGSQSVTGATFNINFDTTGVVKIVVS